MLISQYLRLAKNRLNNLSPVQAMEIEKENFYPVWKAAFTLLGKFFYQLSDKNMDESDTVEKKQQNYIFDTAIDYAEELEKKEFADTAKELDLENKIQKSLDELVATTSEGAAPGKGRRF